MIQNMQLVIFDRASKILILGLLIVAAACAPLANSSSGPVETVELPATEGSLDWIDIYFSEPEAAFAVAAHSRGGEDSACLPDPPSRRALRALPALCWICVKR